MFRKEVLEVLVEPGAPILQKLKLNRKIHLFYSPISQPSNAIKTLL